MVGSAYFVKSAPLGDFSVSFKFFVYEGGSESSVIGVITLSRDMIDCCIIP